MMDHMDLTTSRPVDLATHPAAVYVSRLKPSGRRTMIQVLTVMAQILTGGRADWLTCNWPAVRRPHTAALRARLADLYAPATANKAIAALRGVLREAWRLDLVGHDEYQRAADVARIEGDTIPAGRELDRREIRGLMRACASDHTAAGARDAAIIAIMYACGLRRAEVAALDVADLNTRTGRIVVRGKRGKQRTVYAVGNALKILRTWLSVRSRAPGALFTSRGVERLTPQAIYNVLHKRGAEAGLQAFSPHDLRRTFISDLLDAGADIATVAKLAGHSSVQTTARYDRRTEAAKVRAARLLTLPYRGRG